jgi:hypothetical protein
VTERREPAAHPIRDVLAFFDAEYQRHAGTRYPVNRGKDTKLAKDLLAIYTADQLRTFIAAFFEMDDEFITTAGHSIGVFRGCLPKVIAFVRAKTTRETPKNLIGIEQWMKNRAVNE